MMHRRSAIVCVYAVVWCLSVCLSVCHIDAFCRKTELIVKQLAVHGFSIFTVTKDGT